jgi:hypothetical protein
VDNDSMGLMSQVQVEAYMYYNVYSAYTLTFIVLNSSHK